MKTEQLLRKARTLREQEHKLKPSLRLKTIEEVHDFIRNKGLVSVLGGNELPGLVAAILGRPWKPSRKGFTGWLDWWSVKLSGRPIHYWMKELEREKDVAASRIFRQSKTLISSNLWPALTTIIRHHQELAKNREILSEKEWKILATLQEKGPTRTDHLRSQLRLQGKEHTGKFHRSLISLENYGLIAGYEVPHPEKHLHANVWQLWGMRARPGLKGNAAFSYDEALSRILETTIDTAVLAPEDQLGRWFCWVGLVEAKEGLLKSGRIVRAGSFLLPMRVVET